MKVQLVGKTVVMAKDIRPLLARLLLFPTIVSSLSFQNVLPDFTLCSTYHFVSFINLSSSSIFLRILPFKSIGLRQKTKLSAACVAKI